jgi:orotidine-5'-phosphate decarboxylase
MTSKTHFSDRLIKAVEAKANPSVIGLDPDIKMMPTAFLDEMKGTAPARILFEFNKRVIDIAAPLAAIVKPQIAFYEVYGSEGIKSYEDTVDYAKSKGLIVIGDVKRGDIGHTAEAYATAHLANTNVDAITVNPYFGYDGIQPFIKSMSETGKGIFILLRTSNPTGMDIQGTISEKGSLSNRLAMLIKEWSDNYIGECGYSDIGVVIGAPHKEELSWARGCLSKNIFLLPGYGAQGAGPSDIIAAFDKDKRGAVINASRSIIYAYKYPPWNEHTQIKWIDAVKDAIIKMRDEING